MRYNLSDRITLRLSDGLKNVSENEADDIIIAGMGGELIMKILTDRHCNSFMILQPQSAVHELVEFLLIGVEVL